MERKAFLKVAASSLIVATTMAGCSGAGLNIVRPLPDKTERQAASAARDAERALVDKRAADAIALAEAAVLAEGDNAAHRALLGRAYMLGGRFDSASSAFADALTLGNSEPRTIVTLALIRVTQGQPAQARDLLYTHIDKLPAADYGLAMAMAGDTDEAIRVLGQAIHDPAAGVKERQNLAYAYALSGRWAEARMMAAQDLAPIEAAKRVVGWASMAQPGAETERVYAMLGTRPTAQDTGLPVMLALQAAPQGGEMMLADAGAPASMPAPQAYVTEPARTVNVPVPDVAVAEPVVETFAPPVIRAPAGPVRAKAPAPVKAASFQATTPAKPATKMAVKAPAAPAKGGAWVVQLGAYGTADMARASLADMSKRTAALAKLPTVTTVATVNGKTLHRLAVTGFGDKAGAEALCAKVRAQGGACFTRAGDGNSAPAAMAGAKKPTKVASR